MLASALAVACGGSETAPPPPDDTVTLSAQQVWAGSDFTISSERIARLAQRPTVLLDTIVVPATIKDGWELRVALPPDFPGGRYPVSLRFRDTVLTGPTLSVAGFTGLRPLGAFGFLGYLTAVPNSGQPEVIGGVRDTVVVLNAATGQARSYGPFTMESGSATPNGPGTSWRPDGWVLKDPTTGCGLYRLDASAELIEPVGCGPQYYTAALTPERYLALNKHEAYVVGLEESDGNSMVSVVWPGPAVFSPAGDRMTFPADYSSLMTAGGGHPVYSTPDGNQVFTVPVQEPAAVAFSPDGALLAIGVGSGLSPSDTTTPRVEVFHAVDGTPVGSIPLADLPLAVAFDPISPVLYVATKDSALVVDIYDTGSLTQVGRMQPTAPEEIGYHGFAAITFSMEPALYLVEVDVSGFAPWPTFSTRFSLLRP